MVKHSRAIVVNNDARDVSAVIEKSNIWINEALDDDNIKGKKLNESLRTANIYLDKSESNYSGIGVADEKVVNYLNNVLSIIRSINQNADISTDNEYYNYGEMFVEVEKLINTHLSKYD